MIVKSLEHLNSLSKKVADQLTKNDCIFLIGDIGVGKTTFTRIQMQMNCFLCSEVRAS